MKSIASTLSSRVLKKLNPDQNRYTEQDLRQADLPLPLQKKIVAVMEKGFRDSVSAPDSKWFDGESEMIQSAWQAYLRQAESALFIPSDEIGYVIETAMEQLLNTFCKPREQVLDILFGDDLKQTKKILRYRSDLFDEQHYLGYALLRYMDKKERNDITKAEADKLLLNIDQKITGNYSVQDWERVLRPLFELGGGSVPATLIGQFFEEKQLFSIVNRLNTKGDQEMTPEELSELLLSEEEGLAVPLEPDHPDVQADNEDDSVYIEPVTSSDSLKTDLMDEKDETEDQQAGHTEEEDTTDSEQEDDAGDLHSLFAAQDEVQEEIRFGGSETEPETGITEPEEEDEDDGESASGSLLDAYRDSSADSETGLYDEDAESDDDTLPWIAEETGDEGDEDASIQQGYSFPPESSADIAEPQFRFPDSDPDSDDDTDEGSDTDPYNYSESREVTHDAADSEEDSDTHFDTESDEETESHEETDSEKHTDTPMWKSFLEREDAAGETLYSEEMQGTESPEGNDSEPEPTFLNFFPDDPAETEPEDEPESGSVPDPVRLREWLKKDEKRYLKTLFKNSRMAYEQALTDLMIFDDWKSASGYLEREIFIRNKVDLFSETAVDFTDKLHAFFIKHKP